ncbi:MAG TPA: dynamin family protein [Vicinamibacterales bacterium]|nr:dynamin family protein [Vicinamibacterales bacterium]
MPAPERTALNESQQRKLIITCQHVNRLLADLEHAFVEAQSNSPFGRYVNDLAPAEQRLVQDYIARIRTQLVRVLSGQGLPPTPRQTGVRWSILTHLAYVDVAIEELKPHYMRGYGAVAPEASAALNGIVEELDGTIAQLTRYLSVDRSEDLHARLQRIRTGPDVALLKALEELIAKYGLVEFRSGLGTILDTLERRGLELAVFGRVSTGKSSLLNRLLGRDVLPVGVTPITAVPTRIAFGRDARLHVWFADAPSRQLDVGVLAEYASERGNPANTKRVLRLVVELPAPFLESGVTLVDTPGLGSLATSGAAETLAYLPHCDVAAVLVDASSTITSEDLGTVGALIDAGIRASVLISKADLLNETDLESTLAYLRQTLSREFTASIPVAAVSVKPEFGRLFEEWRESELVPLIGDQQRQREAAAARKTEILRTQVQTTLRRLAQGGQLGEPEASVSDESRTSDSTLQTAAGEIVVLERRIDDVTVVLPRRADEVLSRTADSIDRKGEPQRALDQAFRQVAGETARELSSQLQELVATLVQACRRVSSAVQWIGEFGDTADSEKRFREVPIPALPPEIRVPSQGAERVLGHAVARSITVKRLEHAVGPALRSTLQDYAAVLRRWGLDSLNQIRAEWAATTDAVRADLDRQLGHGRAFEIGPEEVARDLERLSAVVVR